MFLHLALSEKLKNTFGVRVSGQNGPGITLSLYTPHRTSIFFPCIGRAMCVALAFYVSELQNGLFVVFFLRPTSRLRCFYATGACQRMPLLQWSEACNPASCLCRPNATWGVTLCSPSEKDIFNTFLPRRHRHTNRVKGPAKSNFPLSDREMGVDTPCK